MESTQNIELIIIGFLGTIFTTALIASLWVVIMRSSRFVKIKTLEQQLVAERHMQELQRQEARTQEKERARIARDLHDEIGSALVYARAFLQQMGHDEGAETSEGAIELSEHLQETTQSLQRIVAELTPPLLDEFSLTEVIAMYAHRMMDATGIHINMEQEIDHPMTVTGEEKLALYRVIQEMITNAVKHSGTDRIDIRWRETSSFTTIEVTDYGKGFDPTQLVDGKGNGLDNIRKRIDVCGGTVDLKTSPGQGVIYRIELPLSENHQKDKV